jgi:hypothetical protein
MYGLTFEALVNFMALFEVVVYFQTVSVVE